MNVKEEETRVIMKIPNQKFTFLAGNDIDEEFITLSFEKEYTGTIFLVAGVIEDDEDAIMPIGIPDGTSMGKIAFWAPWEGYDNAWNKIIKMKQECIKANKEA